MTILLLVTHLVSAEAQISQREKIHYQLPHIEGQIEVDGIMNEDIWQAALKIRLNYETSPGENIAAPVETTVYLFENGETLFVGFDARDNNPEQIRDFLLHRDNIWSSDFVGIKFDTFGESRKAYQFFTNARSIQADAIQEDFRGDDSTWDEIWDSQAQINKNGYVVEMAIPFQALRFPATGSEQQWGIEVLRFLPRKNFHRISNSPADRSIACSICQFDQLLGFSTVKESNKLRFVPTLTLAKDETREFTTNQPPTDWQSDGTDSSLGLDVRWGISAETYLNATINPDFSQVEADAAQIDANNTFAIFVDEKRPFFLDGSDYFNSPTRLVHTRDLVAPEYGAKVTGQTQGHSYGFIAVKDESTSFLLPGNQGSSLVQLDNLASENQILRYNYDLGNKNTIGVVATNKTADDYSSKMASMDGRYWLNDENSLTYQILSSKTHYSESMQQDYDIDEADISDNAYLLAYDYQSRNWRGYAKYRDFGKDFRADLGFVNRVNYKKVNLGGRRIWYPDENSTTWWNRASVGSGWSKTHDSEGKLLEEKLDANARIQGDYQSVANIGGEFREREWNNIYYNEDFYFVFFGVEPFAGFKLGLNYNWGASIDFANSRLGDFFRISPNIDWQVNQHILASLSYSNLVFDVTGGELFSAEVLNTRVSYLFDERSTIKLTIQYQSVERNPELYNDYDPNNPINNVATIDKFLASQLLYTYTVNPQTLFFAGYSDNGFQDDNLDKIEKEKRSIFMKFSYAWQI